MDNILEKLARGDYSGLDIKKLENSENHFRVRKGRMRAKFFWTRKVTPTVCKLSGAVITLTGKCGGAFG